MVDHVGGGLGVVGPTGASAAEQTRRHREAPCATQTIRGDVTVIGRPGPMRTMLVSPRACVPVDTAHPPRGRRELTRAAAARPPRMPASSTPPIPRRSGFLLRFA
ncbi:MAG: hypothetical protein WKF96_23915, partial [Solirubrobacteraceae bacterium]